MSYDLVFWQQDDADERSPRAILKEFSDGEPVGGIPELPIEEFLAKLVETFPNAVREPNGLGEWIDWTSSDGKSSFQVEWTTQYVWITCRPLDGDRANQMIDVALALGCALYDPQTDKRFAP